MHLETLIHTTPRWWNPLDPQDPRPVGMAVESMRPTAIKECARVVSHLDTRGTYAIVDMLPMRTLVALELLREAMQAQTDRRVSRNKHMRQAVERTWNPATA